MDEVIRLALKRRSGALLFDILQLEFRDGDMRKMEVIIHTPISVYFYPYIK